MSATEEQREERLRRLMELQGRSNAARKENARSVEEEQKRLTEKGYVRALKKQEWETEHQKQEKELRDQGIEDRDHLLFEAAQTAETRHQKEEEKERNRKTTGWAVFNAESLYKAHEKRVETMKKKYRPRIVADADYSSIETIPKENLDTLVSELKEREEKRGKFSRRRKYSEGAVVDSINKRNEVFNKKLRRAFDDYKPPESK